MTELMDEREMLDRCAAGERQAYACLYNLYLEELYRYVYLFTKSRELSEEIVQDVFVKVWEMKEGLAMVGMFKAYVFKMARNQVMDHYRRQQAEFRFQTLSAPFTEESNDQTDSDLIYGQYYQIAQEAINRLPEKRKEIFELKTTTELSLDEIATKLNISKSVVKKQLYAATDFVKRYLRQHGEVITDMVIILFSFFNIT